MAEREKTREEIIEDSLETCRDIHRYYKTGQSGKNEQQVGSHISQYASAYTSGKRSYNDRAVPLSRLMDTELADSARTVVFRGILRLVIYVAIAFVLSKVLSAYVVQSTRVDGASMETALQDGECLMIDKLTYRMRDPERFEIVIFPFEEDVFYIKRIIGLPGETVQILDGKVYIDGEPLEGDIYSEEWIENPGRAEEPIELGENEYFLLGDNRNKSLDSRYEIVGDVELDQFVGRAFFRYYPFDQMGLLTEKEGESEE